MEHFKFPESCQGKEIVIGIDEAGRGPVIGPLVYTAAFWPVSEDEAINKLGFNDSKQLKEEERKDFFSQIKDHPSIGWVTKELSAKFISEEMLKPIPTSLNKLSYNAVVEILNKIAKHGVNPPIINEVYIDTVGDPEHYKNVLKTDLGSDFAKFVIEKKADAKFKVVGAASIIAKVSRDTRIKDWEWNEKISHLKKNFGSGYPSDEVCVSWLKSSHHEIFGFPDIVRFSWSTTKDLIKSNSAIAKVEWHCDEDESSSNFKIDTLFSGKQSKKRERTNYFSVRKMKYMELSDLTK